MREGEVWEDWEEWESGRVRGNIGRKGFRYGTLCLRKGENWQPLIHTSCWWYCDEGISKVNRATSNHLTPVLPATVMVSMSVMNLYVCIMVLRDNVESATDR